MSDATKDDVMLEDNVRLAERNVELSEKVIDLERQLNAAQLEATLHSDNAQLLSERLKLVQAQVTALEHDKEQWRQTASANERLHNEAHSELQSLKAKLAMRPT